MFGEAPPGTALILAAFDIAAACWQSVRIGIIRTLPPNDPGSWNTRSLRSGSPVPTGWFNTLVESTVLIGLPVIVILLLISVASLVHGTARSEPRIYRALVGGTIALVLMPAASTMLAGLWPGFVVD